LVPYSYFGDERGSFTGITQEGWQEINIVETKTNEKRGGHYHKETVELFYFVSGVVDVSVFKDDGKEEIFTVTKGDILIIDPFEVHTFFTKSNAVWINMLSKAHDAGKPDFHKI
jgi:mannose-6-phosphate isomerase-like protein (cupin superfamily)